MGGPGENENCSGEFLDHGQYSRNGILRYERIFGKTFVSTGGVQTTKEFTSRLNLANKSKVLDIGCGTGGSAFFLAKTYSAEVLGLDLSSNMLAIAEEHRAELDPEVRDRVSFRQADATRSDFPENNFDLMYSRDAIMHIAEKEKLYANVFKWLKPGGQVLVTEYTHGKNHPDHPQEYVDYIKQRGYQILTVEGYGKLLEKVGFKNVKAVDMTQEFIDILKREVEEFKKQKDDFVKSFSQADYDELVEGWEVKVVRCSAGDQGWGLFTAEKP